MSELNFLQDLIEKDDFISVLWTIKLKRNGQPKKLCSPTFSISNRNTKWKLTLLHFSTYDKLMLVLLEEYSHKNVLVNCTLKINEGKSLFKVSSLVFYKQTYSKSMTSISNDRVCFKDRILKIRVTLEQKIFPITTSFLNLKYLKDQATSTEDGVKKTDQNVTSNTTLANDFDTLLTSKKFTDFVIKVDGKEIAVHKCILASRSSVFCAMLENKFSETNDGYLEISDMDKDTAFSLIQFLYTSKVIFSNVGETQKLFTAADKYDVTDLKYLCEKYILANMNISNVVDILIFTNCNNAADLKTRALNYAVENFKALDGSHVDHLGEYDPHLLATVFKEVQKKCCVLPSTSK